ncbi:MAG TPA: BlaI/MecI/CopY family transcriptional regulator [Caulobacteraceae bacterium]|nr:BlaI/MecI/CopY family transcriptional regulator [Caulobacteraceae bacterium]
MRISAAESRIMDALWRRGPLVVEDIIADAAPVQNWSDATVKTLIGRLLKKQAIASFREGGRTRYRPLVARDDYLAAESQGLLDRLFGGELSPFVSHFAEHRRLEAGDVARLKALIAKLDDGG